MNTPPELDEILKALSMLPESLDDDGQPTAASPPRKLRAAPSRSIISKIVADYHAGSSSRDLSTKYDLPKSSVLVILNKEGVVRPSARITEEQIEAARVLIEHGKPVALAATELDIAVRSLYYQLKRRGLPTRAS